MNYKSLIFLGGAFVVLLLAVLFVKPTRPQVSSGPDAETNKPLIKDFKPDDARVVKLAKGDREIQLARKDGKWVVASKDDRPADEGRVKNLLDAVRDAKVTGNRLGSPETFEVDEKHRLAIQVLGPDDKDMGRIWAGKSPDFSTGFVLQDATSTKVLEVNQNFSERAQISTEDEKKVLSVDKWYDLKLLRASASDVIDVAFQKGDQKWRIQKIVPGVGPVKPQPNDAGKKDEAKKDEPKAEGAEKKDEKKEPVWRITEPEDAEADDSACNGVCSAVAWLDAKGYADDVKPEEQGLDKPTATTRLVLKDGTTHTLVFGKIGDDYAIVKLDNKPQIWKVDKYSFENLTKPVDKLKKPKEEKKEEKAGDAEKKDGEGAAKAEERKDAPKADEKAAPKKEEPKAEAKKDEKPAEKK